MMKIADTCSSEAMSRNTPEYRSILKATGKLMRILSNNITPICADLVANDLITPDQQRNLRNPNHDAIERAADLVQLLTDKVEANTANYHTLVRILREDSATYKDVLECLALPSDPTPGPWPEAGMTATTPALIPQGDHLQESITATLQQSWTVLHAEEQPRLTTLLNELINRVSGKWEEIGISLRLESGLLEMIKEDNPKDCRACLREMLKEWLKQIDPPPSWVAIIKAVKDAGYRPLARTLRDKYLPNTSSILLS